MFFSCYFLTYYLPSPGTFRMFTAITMFFLCYEERGSAIVLWIQNGVRHLRHPCHSFYVMDTHDMSAGRDSKSYSGGGPL